MNQEQILEFKEIEQEFEQLSQQMQLIEQNTHEMNELKSSLEEIEKEENKEILANLGKNIFIQVEIKKKELIMGVGNKNFIKKSIPDAKEIIEEQKIKLNTARESIAERLEELQNKMQGLILQAEKHK